LLDNTQRGKTSQELLGVGGDLRIVGSLDECPDADTLLLGIAPPGGKIPATWRPIILAAITQRKMDVLSGLHDFVSDDPEFASAAKTAGVKIQDIRKNSERTIARRQGLDERCTRIHTVGHDCSIGKMVVSLELANALKARGRDAKFIATGQTGIMVEGDGLPLDCIVADFVSGAAEKLVLQNQQHEIVLVEGQGSLVHPSYSGVTLSLLHGCAPHALIFCIEIGRERVTGVESVKIPPLQEIMKIYDVMSNIHQPCKIIGIGINSRNVSAEVAAQERAKIKAQTGLPACDVFLDGPDELVNAVLAVHESRRAALPAAQR
jgi:uncharacterized NAD-dependent epimerase/dehydratase family protein